MEKTVAPHLTGYSAKIAQEVTLDEQWEVEYWIQYFNVPAYTLRNALREAGPDATAMLNWLTARTNRGAG